LITTSFMSMADDSTALVSSAGWPVKPEGPGNSASCVTAWSSVAGEATWPSALVTDSAHRDWITKGCSLRHISTSCCTVTHAHH